MLVVALLASLLTDPSTAASAADMDCGDFATQAAAQAFFLTAGPGDPHALDADGDGQACESNPCPCIGDSTPVPLVGATTPPAPTDPGGVETTGAEAEGGSSGAVRRHWARVVRVTDGDTLRVRLASGGERSVRILGIDTPEVYGTQECGGPAASRQMARLAPVGSRVRLESDPSQANQDRYSRLLRYVTRRGVDVGGAQVRRGLARTYVYRDNPFRRTRTYRHAEKAAHDDQRGLWASCW